MRCFAGRITKTSLHLLTGYRIIDLNLIEKGEPYQKLNRSYVIFICTFDPFGEGFYRYTFENICREDTELQSKIETAKRDEEWRREYMTLLMRDKENIEKGFQQGLERGLAQGATEEKQRIVHSLIQMNILTENEIASAAGISLEELQEIKQNLKK